ncbi:MAG TPA: CHRD domain-containing protein [Streptosporangiaceae bacterium]|nr:CHRD domain-containing protein [Streptosporangiaceae bacterium]
MDRKNTINAGPDSGTRPRRAARVARTPRVRRAGLAAVAAGSVAGALFMAAPAFAGAASHHTAGFSNRAGAGAGYSFTTLDNQADPTFNQLLGINNNDVISGYFGSGDPGHPNQGYLLSPPYGQPNYTSENFPGSAQTQVTALNNLGDTAGFWVNGKNTNRGFVEWNGAFTSYTDPETPHTAGSVNQILGINDAGTAVGFYNDASGNAHAYKLNQATGQFTAIKVPAKSATATGINNNGDIVGFAGPTGSAFTWLLHAGHLTTLQFPGGSNTQAFGVNFRDQIVGSYTDGSGTSHGFVLSNPMGPKSHWTTIDDPHGVGSTVVNGINNAGDLVGFYADSAGDTHGMLGTPNTVHVTLTAMPAGTVAVGQDSSGNLTATPKMFGLTPGSAHSVVLEGPSGGTPLAQFGTLTASGVGQASATLDSAFSGSVPSGSRLEILNGTASDSVSTEPIAETPPLSGSISGMAFHLISVEVGASGTSWGNPHGKATISYDPAAQTLSVTVNAGGVTPGMHAAHVHLGSCQSQGGVQYMLMDFVANSQGQIINEHRTVTGVTTPIPAIGWYLNLHQGTSQTILQDGQPTIAFRPLLCAGV